LECIVGECASSGTTHSTREGNVPRVSLNLPAPGFSLSDFSGRTVKLADFRDQKNVLLVFNRGFT